MSTLPLACKCGALRGELSEASPEGGTRIVCYCKDCQAFARFLKRDDVLDPHGGTEIFQVTPAQVTLSSGAEHLRCIRLSEKGMLRWYAECCRTPLGNTSASASLPFIGVIHSLIGPASNGRSREELLGPPQRLSGESAVGTPPPGTHRGAPVAFIVRTVWRILKARLAGRQRPSPLFDLARGAPVVTPRILSVTERQQLGR